MNYQFTLKMKLNLKIKKLNERTNKLNENLESLAFKIFNIQEKNEIIERILIQKKIIE